jgi:hypothetical protein
MLATRKGWSRADTGFASLDARAARARRRRYARRVRRGDHNSGRRLLEQLLAGRDPNRIRYTDRLSLADPQRRNADAAPAELYLGVRRRQPHHGSDVWRRFRLWTDGGGSHIVTYLDACTLSDHHAERESNGRFRELRQIDWTYRIAARPSKRRGVQLVSVFAVFSGNV